MYKRESVSVALGAVDSIEKFIVKHWANYFQNVERRLSNRIWRKAQESLFSIKDQNLEDDIKFQYLALQKQSLEEAKIWDSNLRETNGLWMALPPVDLAYLFTQWTKSSVILEFANELADKLRYTEVDDSIDLSEYLRHLPFATFFVSTGRIAFRLSNRKRELKKSSGFFVSKAWMPRLDNPSRVEEHLLIVMVSGGKSFQTVPIVFPLYFKTVKELISFTSETYFKAENNLNKSIRIHAEEDVRTILPFLLYIASAKSDFENYEEENPLKSTLKEQKRAKEDMGRKDFTSDNEEPSIFRVGSAINFSSKSKENKKSEATNRTVSPHIRRAHFHTYITGSRSDNSQKRILKWVEQTPVNITADTKTVMIRKVQ